MGKLIDLTGRKFGRWTVVERSWKGKHGEIFWLCLCECGEIKHVVGNGLRIGQTKSCGCLAREMASILKKRHGMSGTSIYRTWVGMIQRCTNSSNPAYKNYGGRGITVCQRWRNSFEAFYEDMGPRPDGMTLDRKDNDGNYEPGNCWYVNWHAQAINKRKRKNKSGVRGVRLLPGGKLQVRINPENKTISLGTFKTIEEAAEVRKQGELKYWGKET